MNRKTRSRVAAGVPQYCSLAVRVRELPACQLPSLRTYGPEDGVSAASGSSPGLKIQPSFQNVAADFTVSASRSITACASAPGSSPASRAMTCSGSAEVTMIR